MEVKNIIYHINIDIEFHNSYKIFFSVRGVRQKKIKQFNSHIYASHENNGLNILSDSKLFFKNCKCK